MEVLNVFAKNVRRYRLERGFSQEYLAELCGMHRTYISALERRRRNISLNNVQKIAAALNIEPYKFFLAQ